MATITNPVTSAKIKLYVDNNSGGFSGAADRALITDGNGAVAVSTVTKAELGYLENATSNVQTQLNNSMKLDTSQTFTGGTILQKSNGNQLYSLVHSGHNDGGINEFRLKCNYGSAHIGYNNGSIDFFGDRVEVQSALFRIPRQSSAPSESNNASFGCLYADTSGGNSDVKLWFHNGSTWKEVKLI